MAKRLTITMTNRRLYLMFALSIILIIGGMFLNKMSTENPSITGMVQGPDTGTPMTDAELVAAGFFIVAVLCGFIVYTAWKG